MPLEFTSAGRPVHLSPGTSVQLELNSPLFDEDVIKGSFSYSFSVPAGPNGPLYGFPERPDGASAPGAQLPAELAELGLPLLTGSQRVKSANPSKYSVSVQAGLSGANLSGRLLSSFGYGGLREVPRQVQAGLEGGGNFLYVHGLMLHANDVVANPGDYPYVFAPLRNEYLTDANKAVPGFDAKNINPVVYPVNTVNRWLVNSVAVLGAPAGGTFPDIRLDFVGGALPGMVFVPVQPQYCPFPRLRYVLQCIFEEGGFEVDMAQLLPGELGDLVIVGNAVLVDRGDGTMLRFSLADVVPELTVAQLLAALRQDLGIIVYVDPLTRRVRTGYLVERVATDAAFVDLSARLAGEPEVTIDEPAGLSLSYFLDSDDELTKELVDKQPAPALVYPPVATVADLPTLALLSDRPQNGQVRLVEALDMYYVCALNYLDGVHVTLTWSELVLNLSPVLVNGGGEEQVSKICYTVFRNTLLYEGPTDNYGVPLPAISQAVYRADQTTVARSSTLRLLFYNGLQPAEDGVSTYPQLSHASASGTYSLRLAGPGGTYQRWLAAWLASKLAGVSYKQALLLTPLDLARLDLSKQVHLDGVPYLVRKVSANVPLRKPALLELVRLL